MQSNSQKTWDYHEAMNPRRFAEEYVRMVDAAARCWWMEQVDLRNRRVATPPPGEGEFQPELPFWLGVNDRQ